MAVQMPDQIKAEALAAAKSAAIPTATRANVTVEQLEEVLEERSGTDRRVNSTTLPDGVVDRRKAPRRKSD